MVKKSLSILLTIVMLAMPFAGTASATGPVLSAPKAGQAPGFSWDEASKTLTITASTGDYTSAYTGRPYQQYQNQAEKIVVDGDENTRIGDRAFNSFSKVKSVEIINCGSIGDRAFGQCSALTELTVQSCGDIDVYAFQNCSKLKTVDMGTCGNIAANAFSGCGGLEEISITSCGDIAASVFSGKSSLTDVSIGTCGDIGASAFQNCTSLTSITLNCGNIGNRAFYGCTGLKEVDIVKCGNIGQSAFGSSGLETLHITECGDIEGYAFVDNANVFADKPLKTVEIISCGTIGGSAFTNAKNLESLKIGSCTAIGNSAFGFTSGLKTVEIADCPEIGKYAFRNTGAPVETLTLDNCTIADGAFYMAKITTLSLEDIDSIADGAFESSSITNLTLSNITTLGERVFAGCKGLTNLTIENVASISEDTFKIYDTTLGNNVQTLMLKNVGYIGNYAFYGFNSLTSVVIDGTCGYVGAHAFSGCDSLNKDGAITIQDGTKLGYSNSLVYQSAVLERVTAILKDRFHLQGSGTPTEEIAPEGWTSVKTGENNATSRPGDTQLTKEAKWNDGEKTVADVLLKAYYTAVRQMDIIFVADCSNSMSGFGSPEAMNSNFYNMQSKLMDVTEELLNDGQLDTRVAFSTFGQSEGAVSRFFEKGEADLAADYIWNEIVNYESDTNYSTGLAGALELVKQNAGRNTVVVFISDGQPYCSTGEVPEEYYGVAEAQAIRAAGVQIISVLQQVPENELASSQENMENIADMVFSSTDLEGFSAAVNDAVDYAYTTYTLTDTVDPAFVLDESSIRASAGKVSLSTDENGNTVLIWTLSGVPFTEHTLSFQEKLKADERGIHPTGELDTNEGKAVLNGGGSDVNAVETPVLSRGESLTVHKEWKGDSEAVRPDSIRVTLLRGGEAFETVELTAAQGWSYTWPALDEAYEWSVAETQIPEHYTASVSGTQGNVVITNSYTAPTHPGTGDSSRLGLWTGMLVLAGAAAGTTLYVRRKRSR